MAISKAFAFLIPPGKGASGGGSISGKEIAISSGKLFEMLDGIFTGDSSPRDFDVTFNAAADGTQENECRNLLVEFESSPTAKTGRRIAERLQGVFYISDIDIIRQMVENYFKFIEVKMKTPNSDSEFGYFGLHFILEMPADVIPEENEEDIPEFFELQIKTLFQHAWSEAHHDLGYKSLRDLTGDERRKVAFTAAQAWGADTIFQELANSLVLNDNDMR